MPGSGKTTASRVAEKMAFDVVVMGDFVRSVAEKLGLKQTPRTLGRLMFSLRREHGGDVIAKLTVKEIHRKSEGLTIVDGIRSLDEVNAFRKTFPGFKILAIHAPPDARFRRLNKRERSDDAKSWRLFLERDRRELKIGIGNTIALADKVIESRSLKQLRREVKEYLEDIIDETSN